MSSNYNLSALNDKEFESLCCDLISAELGIRVERFKAGQDQGIDGRFHTFKHEQCIIQCKHYEKSGFSGLLSKLKKIELPKINRLNPDRYQLFTSVPLSPENKNKILNGLFPWVKTVEDIYGNNELEDLLNKHE